MKPLLTDFQKRLCNVLQNCIPVTKRPFQKMAERLNKSEKQILQQIKELKKEGIIRRIGPVINYKALGKKGVLAAAHIEKRKLSEVVKAVNALDGVSHNYLRKHYYNLWFTLKADSRNQIKQILDELSKRFGADFHSLFSVRKFKLDLRFDAMSNGRGLLTDPVPESAQRKVRLSDIEKKILARFRKNLKITSQPFDYLCTTAIPIEKVISIIDALIKKGILRKIAAVVDYGKLGFTANCLFACKVERARIVQVGRTLAKLPIVSHCYQRRPFAGFDYNLFAMCHSRTKDRIDRIIGDFTGKERIKNYVLLPTVKELEKIEDG